MSVTFIETLNGVSKEVEYLTVDEFFDQLLEEDDMIGFVPDTDVLMNRVKDVMKSNEGFDMKDALIYALDKGIISEAQYDAVYPIIMNQ